MSKRSAVDSYLQQNPDVLSQVKRKRRSVRASIKNKDWNPQIVRHSRTLLSGKLRTDEPEIRAESEDEEQEAANALLAMAQPCQRNQMLPSSGLSTKQKKPQKSQPGSWKSSQSSARKPPRARVHTSESEGSQDGTEIQLPSDRCPPHRAEPSGLSVPSFSRPRGSLPAKASGIGPLSRPQGSQINRTQTPQYILCKSSQPASSPTPPKRPLAGGGLLEIIPADLRRPSHTIPPPLPAYKDTSRQVLSGSCLADAYNAAISSEGKQPGIARVSSKPDFQRRHVDVKEEQADGRRPMSSGNMLGLDRGMSCPEPRSAGNHHNGGLFAAAPSHNAQTSDSQANGLSYSSDPSLSRPNQVIRLQLAPSAQETLRPDAAHPSPSVGLPGGEPRLNPRGGNLTILPGQSVDLDQTMSLLGRQPYASALSIPQAHVGAVKSLAQSQRPGSCEPRKTMPAIRASKSQMSLSPLAGQAASLAPSNQPSLPYSEKVQTSESRQGPWGLTVFSALNPCVVTTGHHPMRE